MKPSQHRSWYRIAIARTGKPAVLVAAAGEHLGQAIAAAEAHAGGFVVGVEPATTDSIPLGESVGKHAIVELGELEHHADSFAWPVGVVPALHQRVEGARAGFVAHADPTSSVFEAQLDRDDVGEAMMTIVERLPAADNLEVRLLESFEPATPSAGPREPARTSIDVWLTARVNAKKILAFLDDYDDELFGNGHIELGVYVREKTATLRLTEHKTLLWIAGDHAMDDQVRTWFTDLHLEELPALRAITQVPHVHYRPSKSRDRKKLGEALYRERLRRVATETPASASASTKTP